MQAWERGRLARIFFGAGEPPALPAKKYGLETPAYPAISRA